MGAPIWAATGRCPYIFCPNRQIQPPFQRINSRREGVDETHPCTELDVDRLCVNKLFGQSSFRSGSDPCPVDELMPQHHPEVLDPMLEDDILPLGRFSKTFQ